MDEKVIDEQLTFEEDASTSDSLSLYVNQLNDVASMRNTLLSMDRYDPNNVRTALQNITVMRIYHQISRIIRFTELMDKLEDKMYESIECSLDSMDPLDTSTWVQLASLQEKLQRTMIDSHKLLEPYLNFDALTTLRTPESNDPAATFAAKILDQESRERLRTASQQALAAIQEQAEKEQEPKEPESSDEAEGDKQQDEQAATEASEQDSQPKQQPHDETIPKSQEATEEDNKLKAQQALAQLAAMSTPTTEQIITLYTTRKQKITGMRPKYRVETVSLCQQSMYEMINDRMTSVFAGRPYFYC